MKAILCMVLVGGVIGTCLGVWLSWVTDANVVFVAAAFGLKCDDPLRRLEN